MAKQNPWESRSQSPVRCEDWEAWLVEFEDGTLGEEQKVLFEAHAAQCPSCGSMMEQALKGHAWLAFLREAPPVPAGLMGKILGQTEGRSLAGGLSVEGAVPVSVAGPVMGWHWAAQRGHQQSRLLMTVAMAFFSITLTLNLLGLHPGGVNVRDLSLSSMQRTVVSSFYGTKQKVVHTYENLRFIYEVDAQLQALQQSAAKSGKALQHQLNKSGAGRGTASNQQPSLLESGKSVRSWS